MNTYAGKLDATVPHMAPIFQTPNHADPFQAILCSGIPNYVTLTLATLSVAMPKLAMVCDHLRRASCRPATRRRYMRRSFT